MKKLLAVILTLMLLYSVALAESTLTPDAYLASLGLIVLDEDTLVGMGADMGELDINVPFCALSLSDSTPVIIYKTDKVYISMEGAAMMGSGTLDNKAIAGIFADFCSNFEFGIYTVSLPDGSSITYMSDESFINELPDNANISETSILDTLEEFIATVDSIE